MVKYIRLPLLLRHVVCGVRWLTAVVGGPPTSERVVDASGAAVGVAAAANWARLTERLPVGAVCCVRRSAGRLRQGRHLH